jgi:AdoMet-dependent rRNA methyltransferase SPB1
MPGVITLIGDITTESCKAAIRQELQGAPVDVVLHDGAPNVGASYDKDAYEQNEIALHSLKCATQHLKRGGSYITKLYRSRDYASFMWIVQQFFRQVQAVKPAASRAQSAEIFLVCQDYIQPDKIDPRMLDPKCVFEQVEGDSTGGGNSSLNSKLHIFHKSWGVQKRHRDGYDMETLDATMRNVKPICEFIEGKDPIHLLSHSTGMKFQCSKCEIPKSCDCQFYLQHPSTTTEIKACVSDLKVLNKSDFKGLLTWRTKLQDALKKQQEQESDDDEDAKSVSSASVAVQDSEEEEEGIQSEIAAMRQRRSREKKKTKKKERALAAKRRRRAALGMDLNAVEVPEHDQIFSLATISSKGDLEAAREVELDKVTDEQLFGGSSDEEDNLDQDEVESQGEPDDLDEDTGYSYRLDRELDDAYETYLRNTKNGLATSGTKMTKRSKKLLRLKAVEEANQDQELIMADESMVNRDMETYAKMLQGPGDSDDEKVSDEEDDGFNEEPLTPAEHKTNRKTKEQKVADNPLIYKLPEEPTSVKTARWFSNPLFESIGTTAQLAAMSMNKEKDVDARDIDFDSDKDEDEVLDMSSGDEEDQKPKKKKAKVATTSTKKAKKESAGISAEDVLAAMPKTDKQIRHERRLKAMERQERKKARKARRAGETGEGFEVAAASDDEDEENARDEKLQGLSEQEKKKLMEARALIKAGLGSATQDASSSKGFEVVSAEASREFGKRPLPLMDERVYDSDNEDYNSDDYAQTLALGTMMLRKSKAKALVDASYNRYAWNDPTDLPEWFVDDENRHYRPQLPIPPELMAKMKEKMLALSTKPIAKVAEARARKNKRAKTKLVAAKKKAEALANSSEMSETMKLKAISKAMRGQDARKPGKTYVVSKKGRGTTGTKGVKFVDKRMRSDKKAMDRKVNKKGKRGGLTGTKRRRNHS